MIFIIITITIIMTVIIIMIMMMVEVLGKKLVVNPLVIIKMIHQLVQLVKNQMKVVGLRIKIVMTVMIEIVMIVQEMNLKDVGVKIKIL